MNLPSLFRNSETEIDGRSNKNKVLDALDHDIARLEQIDSDLTQRIDRDTYEREGVRDSLEALSLARNKLRDPNKEITLEVSEIAPAYNREERALYDPTIASPARFAV